MIFESSEKKKNMFVCVTCDKSFSTSYNLKQHKNIHTNEKSFICDICSRSFGRNSSLKKHKTIHLRDNLTLSSTEVIVSTEEDVSVKNEVSSKKLYTCNTCLKVFGRRSNLIRHQLIHNKESRPTFKCDKCDRVFTRRDNLILHLLSHLKSNFSCIDCDKVFHRKFELRQHIRSQHPRTSLISVKRKSNVKAKIPNKQRDGLNVFKTLMFYPTESNESDLKVYQVQSQTLLEKNLLGELQEKGAIKWYIAMKISLERVTDDGIEEIQSYFRGSCFVELTEDSIQQHIEEGFSKINSSFEEFLQRGSEWILQKIHYLELKTDKYHPLDKTQEIL